MSLTSENGADKKSRRVSNIPRHGSFVKRCLADPSFYDFGVAIFAGAAAVYNALGKNDGITALFAMCICALSIRKATISIRKNLNQKSIHELEGCLNTLHAMISRRGTSGASLWMTLHVPIQRGQRLEQIMDYVSDDESLRSGAGRKFPAQSGVIGVALREKEPILAVRQNSDHQAYIHELKRDWSYTDADARKTNPATMRYLRCPVEE